MNVRDLRALFIMVINLFNFSLFGMQAEGVEFSDKNSYRIEQEDYFYQNEGLSDDAINLFRYMSTLPLETIQLRIREGRVSLFVKDSEDFSVLHRAAAVGRLDVVIFLVNTLRASTNLRDYVLAEDVYTLTARDYADIFRHQNIVDYLTAVSVEL